MCRAAAFRLAVRQSGDLLDEFGLSVGDGGVTQRDKGIRASPKNAPGLPNCGAPPRGAPTAPRTVRSAWGAAPRSSIPAERSAACDPSHEHQILRRDRHRGHATAPRIVEPVDGHALGRRRETDLLDEGARTATCCSPSTIRVPSQPSAIERRGRRDASRTKRRLP
jgi:hypothetical protein